MRLVAPSYLLLPLLLLPGRRFPDALQQRRRHQPITSRHVESWDGRAEDMRLQDLAEMDVREMVQQVQEYFGDFIALEPHHFLVPLPRTHLAMQPFAWDFGNSSDAVARMTEGVASLVLSLRRRFLIRCVRWVAAAAAAAAGGVRLAVLV